MKKRGLAVLLAGIMTVMTPMAVMADREDAKLETPYISLGADLKQDERAKVLELLGVTEDELKNYTVAEVTNKDEHKYLDGYLDASVIGSRALSSVLVVGKESGYGIKVKTQNIPIVLWGCTRMRWQRLVSRTRILMWRDRSRSPVRRRW